MKSWFRALALALTVLVAGSDAFAQPLPQIRTVYNPAPKDGQEFGFPLAVYGEDLLVALAWSDGEVQQHGKLLQIDLRSGAALRTFDRPRGPTAKTRGKDPANSAVTAALNVEDRVLVGMPYDDAGGKKFAGAVHQFYSHDGALLRTLTVPPKAWNRTLEARDSRFGASVALASGGALVGAPGLQHPAPAGAKKPFQRAGAAFLFDLQTGALLQAFAKDNPRADDRFGASVAGGRGMALVAAPGDAGGAVYAFNPGDAALIRAFRRQDGKPNDGFGHALCLVGDRLLVGAPGESALRPSAGAVYVFDLGTGAMERVLRPTTQKGDDFFGYSLAAAGTRALIGAHGIDRGAGAVFVVDPAGTDILATLRAPRSVPESGFGMSLAVMGEQVAVSAHREPFGEEGAAVGTGVVYLVPLPVARATAVPVPAAGAQQGPAPPATGK